MSGMTMPGSNGKHLLFAVLIGLGDAFLLPLPCMRMRSAIAGVRMRRRHGCNHARQPPLHAARSEGDRLDERAYQGLSKEAKLAQARQLLEESRLAFEESRVAKARRQWGTNFTRTRSVGELQEVRFKEDKCT